MGQRTGLGIWSILEALRPFGRLVICSIARYPRSRQYLSVTGDDFLYFANRGAHSEMVFNSIRRPGPPLKA